MKTIIDFMFNGIANEATVNDGIGFVRFSATSFVTKFISCTTTSLGLNSIYCYLLFVFKFVVQVILILVAMLLGMSWFIALIVDHICLPSFVSLLLLSWWFQQFLIFIGVSNTFFTSDCIFFMFKQGVPLHPCCGYPEIWL